MPVARSILVFIPTYNDFDVMANILAGIAKLGPEYQALVIDDGSEAAFNPAAAGSKILYVKLPANFGLGVSTNIAFDHMLKHRYDAIVRIDADGQHPPDLIPALIDKMYENNADLVLAQRQARGDGASARDWARFVVRAYFAFVTRMVTGNRNLSDVNTGFFALTSQAASAINKIDLERYPEPQMIIHALRSGLTLTQLDIEQNARAAGRSTITLFRALQMIYRFNILVLDELLTRK